MKSKGDTLHIEYNKDGIVVGIYGPKITDYWDHQHDQITRMAQVCADLGPEAVVALQRSVPRLAAALSRYWLAMSAFIMAEDLYKTSARPMAWTETVGTYLGASAKSLLAVVKEQGLVAQYVIDNVPTASPEARDYAYNHYGGACAGYPLWFRSAGFVYASPQEAAGLLMTAEGIDLRTFADRWPEFAVEARGIAIEVVKKAQSARQHFVYYDADWEPPSEEARSEFGAGYVIGLFRTEAPAPESNCELTLPPGLSEV